MCFRENYTQYDICKDCHEGTSFKWDDHGTFSRYPDEIAPLLRQCAMMVSQIKDKVDLIRNGIDLNERFLKLQIFYEIIKKEQEAYWK